RGIAAERPLPDRGSITTAPLERRMLPVVGSRGGGMTKLPFKRSSANVGGTGRRWTKRLIAIGAVVAVLGVGGIAAAASLELRRTEANEWGCTFGRGPFDGKGLKGEYAPGSDGTWTNDAFVTGPADIRF